MWQIDQRLSQSKFYNSFTIEITAIQRGPIGYGHYAGVLENTKWKTRERGSLERGDVKTFIVEDIRKDDREEALKAT